MRARVFKFLLHIEIGQVYCGTENQDAEIYGTNVGYDLLYCVKENQHAAAYHSLYLSLFLSLQ